MPLLAPIIEGLIAGMLWLFKNKLGFFILSAMVWLGINWTTLNVIVEPAMDLLRGQASAIGGGSGTYAAYAHAWIGVLNFDKAITMILSAVATRHTMLAGRLMLTKAASVPGVP